MNQIPENIFDYALSEEAALRPERPRDLFDHWQPHILLERAAYLRKLARAGSGSASETLREYPQHAAMLSFRGRSGEAEVHEKFADVFYVLAGEATLVTGGTVVSARTEAPGETRGPRGMRGSERRRGASLEGVREGVCPGVCVGAPW